MIKSLKKYLMLGLSALILTGSFAGCVSKDNNNPEETVAPRDDLSASPKSQQLKNTGEWQQRWLSIPESRLVINPYDYQGWDKTKPQSAYTDSAKIPLNIGYLDPYYNQGDGRDRWYNTLMILSGDGSTKDMEAKSFNTSWEPHMLGFSAEYENGLKINGRDYFYDTDTIIRDITYEGNKPPIVGGLYYLLSQNRDTCTAEGNTLIVNTSRSTLAITFSVDVEFTFYRNYDSLVANTDSLNTSIQGGNCWKAVLKESPKDNKFSVAVTVLSDLTSKEDTVKQSREAAQDSNLDDKYKERLMFWDDYLAKIPIPGSFEFETIDSKGVTSRDIDQMYYEAWVLMAADVLPENPEVGFNYKQMACGKPSMWAWGHNSASFTAAWDSIYAYHMYAFVDPDTAWNCFEGLMSLVEHSEDENRNGMLAGESLPVNRARTAWLLYEIKPDKSKLEAVFENLDLNLNWSINHTYWIYKDNYGLNEKIRDSDFTASAFIDMPYMVKICRELGKEDKAQEWEKNIEAFTRNFPRWHIEKKRIDGKYVEIAKNPGRILFITKALYIPELTEEQDMAIYRLLQTTYDKDKTFVGFKEVKLEVIMYTIYGLFDKGFSEMAKSATEASIREIVRSRMFSENYTSDEQPVGDGVRVSMFGPVQLIDSIWIRNGFRYDTCQPMFQNFYGTGSVTNIRYGDRILNYKLENNEATLTGSYVGEDKVIELSENSQIKPFER